MSQFRPRLSQQQYKALENLRANERRILVIGDLHCPFELEGYLEHCLDTYDRFNCNQVIFIGDIHNEPFHAFAGCRDNRAGYAGLFGQGEIL